MLCRPDAKRKSCRKDRALRRDAGQSSRWLSRRRHRRAVCRAAVLVHHAESFLLPGYVDMGGDDHAVFTDSLASKRNPLVGDAHGVDGRDQTAANLRRCTTRRARRNHAAGDDWRATGTISAAMPAISPGYSTGRGAKACRRGAATLRDDGDQSGEKPAE